MNLDDATGMETDALDWLAVVSTVICVWCELVVASFLSSAASGSGDGGTIAGGSNDGGTVVGGGDGFGTAE